MDKTTNPLYIITSLLLLVALVVAVLMFVIPKYKVWQRELAGIADLREAEWSKQIQIEEAKARLEAEKLNRLSEVERAKGVAEANEIISVSIDEQYLRYLWVEGLHDGSSEVIYVPTEGNLPIFKNIK